MKLPKTMTGCFKPSRKEKRKIKMYASFWIHRLKKHRGIMHMHQYIITSEFRVLDRFKGQSNK
jgi:hypothetical protein